MKPFSQYHTLCQSEMCAFRSLLQMSHFLYSQCKACPVATLREEGPDPLGRTKGVAAFLFARIATQKPAAASAVFINMQRTH